MRVAVGSTNPVKVSATRLVFSAVFGSVDVLPTEVDSGIPAQPFGEETMIGAENRAKEAVAQREADYGVGIEGGIVELTGRYYNLGTVVILDKSGFMGTGTSGWFEIPQKYLAELRTGTDLAEVVDKQLGTRGVGRSLGAVGVFTRGKVTREDLYVHGLYMALIPHLNRQLWTK